METIMSIIAVIALVAFIGYYIVNTNTEEYEKYSENFNKIFERRQ